MKKNKIFLFSATLLAGVSLGITSVHADEANANIQETTVSQSSMNTVSSAETTSVKQNNEASATVQSAASNSQTVTAVTSGETQATSSSAQSTETATTQTAQAAYYYNSNYGRGWHSKYNNYDGTTTWTYAKNDGTMANYEWLLVNGSWYFFGADGELATNGWHQAPWHGNYKYYYFDANGHYETNCWHSKYDKVNDVTTWTYSKSDGTQADYEWLWINGSWYFFGADGELATNGWHQAPWHGNYKYYYFDANGHYETNCWHSKYDKVNDVTTWTYSKSDGTQADYEWLWINGSWYFFGADGELATNGWHQAPWHGNYKYYYFDANGHYETNCWHSKYDKVNDVTTWTYSKSDGTQADYEWLWINGSWYFFRAGGELATNGWHQAPWHGQYNWYYFDANGHC